MALPPAFTLSQASLQDFVDCPRRFQLRFLLGVHWPAAQDGPIAEWERRAQRGAAFHRLLYQHTVGIPMQALDDVAHRGGHHDWWQAYHNHPPRDLPVTVRRAEARLSMLTEGVRLVARYDLLALDPGVRAVIVDWKTNERLPPRSWLEKRMQTLVYPLVLAEAGAHLNGGEPFAPEQIELVYWFAKFPQQQVRIGYSRERHEEASRELCAIIARIASLADPEWPLTSDLRRCRYCQYRTLCAREAVESDDPEHDPEADWELTDFDLEQIAEIEF